MAVDLHTHSIVSDGSETPTEVVTLAAAQGLSAVALTDHDILSGVEEARRAGDAAGIEVIPGIELSIDWSSLRPESGGGMHMVVLWIEDTSGPLQDQLAGLRDGRDSRNHTIVERLNQLGLEITMEEVAERAGGGSVGRPHIAGVLQDRGHVETVEEAFDRFLGSGGPAYASRARLGPAEALDLVRRSGGVAILAHPFTLGIESDHDLEGVIAELADMGLGGLESHHSRTEPDRRRLLRRMAERRGLAASGGSDFHGSYKLDIAVGVGVGDLSVPDEFLADLRSRRTIP